MTDRSVIAYPAILHFSESRHYIREVSPANTMAYDNSRHMHLELELQEGSGTSDVMFFITTHRILYTYQAMGQSPFPGVRDVECRWSVEPSTDGTSAPNSAKTGGTRKCNMRPRRPLGSPSHSWRMGTSLRRWRCSNIWVSCCLMMTMIPRLC